MFNCYEQKKETVKISNFKTGLDLKTLYLNNNNLSKTKFKLRLFNKGFEINEHVLSTHNITLESQIQVIVKEEN